MSKHEAKELVKRLIESADLEKMEEMLLSYELQRKERIHFYRIKQEEWLILHFKTSIDIITCGDILYAEAQGAYCDIFLKSQPEKKLTISNNLHWLEQELRGLGFIRISRDHLINLLAIKEISPSYKYVLLKPEIKLAIEPAFRDEVKREMKEISSGFSESPSGEADTNKPNET